jgi:hypothetical protein
MLREGWIGSVEDDYTLANCVGYFVAGDLATRNRSAVVHLPAEFLKPLDDFHALKGIVISESIGISDEIIQH